MLFNSLEFVYIFLPVTVLFYFYLNSKRLTEAAKGFLVFSSLFFYSWWDIRYLPLILGSILFNYVIGITLSRSANYRKPILLIGIACNLGLLGLYKYADFFIEKVIIRMTYGDSPKYLTFRYNMTMTILNRSLPF